MIVDGKHVYLRRSTRPGTVPTPEQFGANSICVSTHDRCIFWLRYGEVMVFDARHLPDSLWAIPAERPDGEML